VLSVAHKPVLLKEVLSALSIQPGGRYVDCTLGGGGHCHGHYPGQRTRRAITGNDADPEAIRAAAINLSRYTDSVLLVNDNFVNIDTICHHYDFIPFTDFVRPRTVFDAAS